MDIWRLLRSVNRFHQLAREEERRLVSRYRPFTNIAVDLGCGESKFVGTIGLDIDREVHPNIVGDMAHLPIKDNVVNTIISNSVLEHLHDINRSLAEIARVASDDCVILFTITTDRALPYPNFIKKITATIWKMSNNLCLNRWRHLLATHNLVVRRTERYYSIVNHILYLLGLWFFPTVNKGRKVHIFLEVRKRENN